MKEIRDIIAFWEAHRGEPLALATLVATRGASYRRPGARMLINAEGKSAGGLSAGCIEEEVIACASQVLRTGRCEWMTFDTRLRFGCNGAIDIFVEPLCGNVIANLRDCLSQRRSCRLETLLHGNARGTRIAGLDSLPGAFLQTIEPGLRLVLLGDSSDTDALRQLAGSLGWDVWQIDRPSVPLEILDDRTAVVIATHNFGRDSAALRDLLPVGLKYLGLIGSRRRRDDILFDVMNNGVNAESALFAPAGLHLCAETPEEIALSIVAEIQCVFASATGQQLRHRKAPIHQPVIESVVCTELAP